MSPFDCISVPNSGYFTCFNLHFVPPSSCFPRLLLRTVLVASWLGVLGRICKLTGNIESHSIANVAASKEQEAPVRRGWMEKKEGGGGGERGLRGGGRKRRISKRQQEKKEKLKLVSRSLAHSLLALCCYCYSSLKPERGRNFHSLLSAIWKKNWIEERKKKANRKPT